jgi:tRNA pseudouridine38-40 synthase
MSPKMRRRNVPTCAARLAQSAVGIPTSPKLGRGTSGRNLKLEIEYDGTNYCGWQVQRKAQSAKRKVTSIQQTIEAVLGKILQEKVRLIASGRTDAGVHAQGQVANFQTFSPLKPEKLRRALNALLPSDIVIKKVEEVPLAFHSRFQAKSKLYCYTLLNRGYPSAFLAKSAYFYPYPLDLKLMQQEAKTLQGRHNFSSFRGSASRAAPYKTIQQIRIVKEKDLVYTYIRGSGFLYNMVRVIVGTLLEIGRGRLPAGSIKRILAAKNRCAAGPTAPARGLSLVEVSY